MSDIASAIYAMLAASLLGYIWTGAVKASAGKGAKYDNANPRSFAANTVGWRQRAYAISSNSYESLPIYLASVLAALFTAVNAHNVAVIAWCYVGLRITYGLAYLANLASVRSIIWVMGMACPILLFILAAKSVG